jgi:hypothetical protein
VCWIPLLFGLLYIESRAIDKDKKDSEKHFTQILDQEQGNLQQILNSQNAEFKNILNNQQNAFDGTIKRIGQEEQAQAHAFDDVVKREDRLLDRFREMINTQNSIQDLQNQAHLDSLEISLELREVQKGPILGPSPSVPNTNPPTKPVLLSEDRETQSLRIQGLKMARDMNDWIEKVSGEVPKPGMDGLEEQRAYQDRLDKEFMDLFSRADMVAGKLHAQGILIACRPLRSGSMPNILGLRKNCADAIEKAAMR